MRRLLLLFLALAGCVTEKQTDARTEDTAPSTDKMEPGVPEDPLPNDAGRSTPDADATAALDGSSSEPETPVEKPVLGPPIQTGAANVPEFKPAFPQQTRAPSIKTKAALKVTEIASGFNLPWALAFLPDGRMLVTEKHAGKLSIVGQDGKKSAAVAGLPRVDGRGQGGLLDVEIAPDYATSKVIFWTYYEPREGGNGLAVARARLVDGAAPRVEDVKVIFSMQPTLESTLHAGGRLVFARDGKLFVTLGERSILPGRVQARELGSHFGKIVRINQDGSVPSDNPFVDKAGARPEIWSYGHRNVLSAALDAKGRLWEVEMGPKGGDEVNLAERGKDYGWPIIGYGEEYSGERIHQTTQSDGLEQPVYYWDPVISPSGLTIYSGTLFPEWRGNLFIGALSGTSIVRLVLDDNDRVLAEERLLTDQKARIREVVQGPEGALYVLTDSANGKLLKVTPATP